MNSTTAQGATQAHGWIGWGREIGKLLLLVVGLLALRDVVANQYTVPSRSMEPNLQVGDHVLVDMHSYGWRVPFTMWRITPGEDPKRGDVVVFQSPDDGLRLIKRVVATEGDAVSVQDGRVYVNGAPAALDDAPDLEWHHGRAVEIDRSNGTGPATAMRMVPAGKVLVLGDNRGNSVDGREFGFVDQATVYGKATRVIYRRGQGLGWKAL